VRNANGDMVPIGTLTTVSYQTGPSLISLYNLRPSAQVLGAPSLDFSSGQALALLEQIAGATLPSGMGYEWTGMSYQEKAVGYEAYYVFALALLLVYLALAAQYESWSAPAAVLPAVPIALLGTVAALTPLGVANNLYMQIGLVLLIALASKNAILIVEFARDLRIRQQREILGAAIEAARLRFRPILMTSFALSSGYCRWCSQPAPALTPGDRSASRWRAACSPRPALRCCSCRHSSSCCSALVNARRGGRWPTPIRAAPAPRWLTIDDAVAGTGQQAGRARSRRASGQLDRAKGR
jgi:AcrB/AcrD/AcrF family